MIHQSANATVLDFELLPTGGFVAQRFHNYMILKVLIIFDPKLNLFKSDAYIFMQQSPDRYKSL
ncbi:hypothetical protein MKS78_04300 [Acinetobacter baumannii]